MTNKRELEPVETQAILHTAETPGFRLLCDLLQAEVDNTISHLDDFDLPEAKETRLLAYLRAYRRILAIFIHHKHDLALSLAREIDPDTTRALFTPGASDELTLSNDPDDDPLAPWSGTSPNVVVE